MSKKILNKDFILNAELFRNASYFAANNDPRYYLEGICIFKSEGFNKGTFVTATDGHKAILFLDSNCKNFPELRERIFIQCIHKNNKLTQFIKDVRKKSILKNSPKLIIRFLKNDNCKIRFNNKTYTFKYGFNYPAVDKIFSRLNVKPGLNFSYQPKFIHSIKHLDLSSNSKTHEDRLIFATASSGEIIAIKPGAIMIAMPIFDRGKKRAIGEFIHGIYKTKSKDVFEKALHKKKYIREFGSWLGNQLYSEKAKY